jgi:hypothetical protein
MLLIGGFVSSTKAQCLCCPMYDISNNTATGTFTVHFTATQPSPCPSTVWTTTLAPGNVGTVGVGCLSSDCGTGCIDGITIGGVNFLTGSGFFTNPQAILDNAGNSHWLWCCDGPLWQDNDQCAGYGTSYKHWVLTDNPLQGCP